MSKGPKLTHFVSEMDKFLNEFNEQHPKLSKAQQKEVDKYRRIYRLRDNPDATSKSDKLWEDF